MRFLVLPALLLAAACAPEPSEVAPEPADVSLSDEAPPGEERAVITTQDGDIDLGLTDRVLYVRLNPKRRAEIEDEMAAEVGGQGGLGGFVAETVTDAVSGALAHAVEVPVERVRSVRYEDGRLDIEVEGGGRFPSVENDGRPFEEAFAPTDARRFVEAFERLKAER